MFALVLSTAYSSRPALLHFSRIEFQNDKNNRRFFSPVKANTRQQYEYNNYNIRVGRYLKYIYI